MSSNRLNPTHLITNWNINETNVSLFSDQSGLKFSVVQGENEIQKGNIPLNLYSMSYAMNLVELFHDAIEFNLDRDLRNHKIQPSSFLPVLCTDVLAFNTQSSPPPNNRVALFGRVDRIQREVFETQWTLYNPTQNRPLVNLEDSSPEMTEKFLLDAPRFNLPHEDERYNYEMTAFTRQFRVIYSTDDLAKQHFVSLKYVSRLDRNQLLTDTTRAVTIISRDNWTHHAELVIEGIDEQGLPFRKVLHFQGEEGISEGKRGVLLKLKTSMNILKTQNGRVDIHSELKEFRHRTSTWELPAENIERMLNFAQWQIDRQTAGKKNWSFFNARGANSGILGTYNSLFSVMLSIKGATSRPKQVKKFETYSAFHAYQEKHPPLKFAFSKIINNHRVLSFSDWKFYCQFDPYESWICSYELDSTSDIELNSFVREIAWSEQVIPLNAKNITIYLRPDNCICYIRHMLFLAGLELPKTDNFSINFDRPLHYTKNPSLIPKLNLEDIYINIKSHIMKEIKLLMQSQEYNTEHGKEKFSSLIRRLAELNIYLDRTLKRAQGPDITYYISSETPLTEITNGLDELKILIVLIEELKSKIDENQE